MLTRCSLLLLATLAASVGGSFGCATSKPTKEEVAKWTARAEELCRSAATIESMASRVEGLSTQVHERNRAERAASRFAAVAADPHDASVRQKVEEQITEDLKVAQEIRARGARVRTAVSRGRMATKEMLAAKTALAAPHQSDQQVDNRVTWHAATRELDAASTELHAAAAELAKWTWQFQK